jgi:hypothetical protein
MTTTTDPVQFALSAQQRKATAEDVAREAGSGVPRRDPL